jgi:sortase A
MAKKNVFRRWTERTLLVGGLAGVGLWLGSNAITAIWQSWDNWFFDQEVRETSPSASNRSTPLEDNALIGRITIPRLGLNTTVREGTGDNILLLAAGHMRGTAFPGGNGNVAVAGHRDTLFSGLARIQKNDLIEFETLHGSYRYQVASMEIVPPDDVSVLKPHRYSELTLITCYPFDYIGPAPKRFIVKARQISAGAPQLTLAKATVQASQTKPESTRDSAGKETFYLSKRHSRQLTPGISIGLDETDVAAGQVNGWLWIMPDRRTIWLKDQPVHEPLIFYQSGEKRELMITSVTDTSIAGYLRSDSDSFTPELRFFESTTTAP